MKSASRGLREPQERVLTAVKLQLSRFAKRESAGGKEFKKLLLLLLGHKGLTRSNPSRT